MQQPLVPRKQTPSAERAKESVAPMRVLFANRNEWIGAGRLTALGLLGIAIVVLVRPVTARAEEMPVFSIELKDGVITPRRVEVPANRPFKIELHNTGNTPAEFESNELHREKVLAPHSSSFIVIRRLDPGEYKFFDDFHLDTPPAVLVAK
jgi:Cupredoxin-like domain